MAQVNELTMNFASGQVGGAEDYQVSLFCWNSCVLLMSSLVRHNSSLIENSTSGQMDGAQDYPVELILLEFRCAAYEQLR